MKKEKIYQVELQNRCSTTELNWRRAWAETARAEPRRQTHYLPASIRKQAIILDLRSWRSRNRTPDTRGSDFPAPAIMGVDILIGFRRIPGTHIDGVPFNFLSNAEDEIAKQHHLGERAGNVKI